jgi:hypothetical protein
MAHRGFCKLGSGPYPTLAQEQEILARHGGKAPARPAECPEPEEHSGWQEVKQADTAGKLFFMERTLSTLSLEVSLIGIIWPTKHFWMVLFLPKFQEIG